MIKKFKDYLVYRKNKKIYKKNIAMLGATALPLINLITSNGLNFVAFATNVMNECKGLEHQELINKLENIYMESIKIFADKFETTNERLFEIVKYVANLDKEDIKKIVVDAQLETLNKEK